jgi:WD40 repeat protein
MNGHTGWVRSLATSGKYLFSCGCNYLRQWDVTYPIPKEVGEAKLYTGDILAIATGGDKVFTCGADGSLRSWTVSKTGELVEGAVREKAHDGRATALAVHGSLVYSAGYDGNIKVRGKLLCKKAMVRTGMGYTRNRTWVCPVRAKVVNLLD